MPRAAPVTSALRVPVTMVPRSPSKEWTMTDRWFSEPELEQLSRPTMDRALEALDRGDLDVVRRLCSEMKHEWQMLHDLMASGLLDLVSFIQQRLGGEGGAGARAPGTNPRGGRPYHAGPPPQPRGPRGLLPTTLRRAALPGGGPH